MYTKVIFILFQKGRFVNKIYLFITLLPLLCFAAPRTSNSKSLCITFSNKKCIIRDTNTNTSDFIKIIERAKASLHTQKDLFVLCDSFGYFHYSLDSTNSDTVLFVSGPRSFIDTIIVQSTIPLSLDTVSLVTFPLFYDAGTINSLIGKLLEILSNRGYPFATISLSLSATKDSSTKVSTAPNHLSLFLTCMEGPLCIFDTPLIKTNISHTTSILRHDIIFTQGKLFSKKLIQESKSRLLCRNYISEVLIHQPFIQSPKPYSSQNQRSLQGDTARDSYTVVTVPLTITQKNGLGVDGAIGFQNTGSSSFKDNATGVLSMNLLNIFHRAETVALVYKGDQYFQQFDLSIAVPYLFNLPFILTSQGGIQIQQGSYGFMMGMIELTAQVRGSWQVGCATRIQETSIEETSSSYNTYGFEFIAKKVSEPFRDGSRVSQVHVRTGTDIVSKEKRQFHRWRMNIKSAAHLPLFNHQALSLTVSTQSLSNISADSLVDFDKFRVGGSTSIRGYVENQFYFQAVFFGQCNYHYYFHPHGSIYGFCDPGIGFPRGLSQAARTYKPLVGYGVGIRIPVHSSLFSLAWGRNIQEKRGFGRIHIRYINNLSLESIQ